MSAKNLESKKTLVLGASSNPGRYSHVAVMRLVGNGHPVIALGAKEGAIGDRPIVVGRPNIVALDTVSMYLNPRNQDQYLDYLINLKPKRVIFNPGSENPTFMKKLTEAGIEVLPACTLVMLSVGNY